MPSIRSQELVDAILDAISRSGETGVLLSSIRDHPRRFAVAVPDVNYFSPMGEV